MSKKRREPDFTDENGNGFDSLRCTHCGVFFYIESDWYFDIIEDNARRYEEDIELIGICCPNGHETCWTAADSDYDDDDDDDDKEPAPKTPEPIPDHLPAEIQ